MHKRVINFTDFDGNKRSEVYWFNITKSELTELELSESGSFATSLQRIVDSKDIRAMVREFKRIILLAYGVRDGDMFRKSEEISRDFQHTPAYDALFTELTNSEDAMVIFVQAVMPEDVQAEIQKANEQRTSLISATATPPLDPAFAEMQQVAAERVTRLTPPNPPAPSAPNS